MNTEDIVQVHRHSDPRKVALRIERKVGNEMRGHREHPDVGEVDRIAVGRRLRHRRRRDLSPRAGAVLDDDALPDVLGELFDDDAGGNVGAAPGGEADQHADRPARENPLRESERRAGECDDCDQNPRHDFPLDQPENRGSRYCSTGIPASLITRPQVAYSRAMCCASSSGVDGVGSSPCLKIASWVSGSRSVFTISRFSRTTTFLGVFAGATNAYQFVASYPG